MEARNYFDLEDAINAGRKIGIDWNSAPFSPHDLLKGMIVELEHGTFLDSRVNITNNDALMTAKIAWAHLMESPEYYDLLEQMEKQIEEQGDKRDASIILNVAQRLADNGNLREASVLLDYLENIL